MSYSNIFIIFKFIFRLLIVYTLYKPLYISCNKRSKYINSKGVLRSTTKSKTLLSMVYFMLIWLIVINMTPRFLLVSVFILSIGGLYAYDKFLSTEISRLYAYDQHKIVRYGWKIFAAINLMIYLILNPVLDLGWSAIKSRYGKYINMIKMFCESSETQATEPSVLKLDEKSSCMSDYVLHTENPTSNSVMDQALNTSICIDNVSSDAKLACESSSNTNTTNCPDTHENNS